MFSLHLADSSRTQILDIAPIVSFSERHCCESTVVAEFSQPLAADMGPDC